MKTKEVLTYLKSTYVNDQGFPINEEAEKIVNNCYEAKEAIIAVSTNWAGRATILTEVSYITEELALYKIIAPDPAAWETFIGELRNNKVTARDLQSIRSVVGNSYKALIKEAEEAYLEATVSDVIKGVKSFTAEYGRSGITLKIVYMEKN